MRSGPRDSKSQERALVWTRAGEITAYDTTKADIRKKRTIAMTHRIEGDYKGYFLLTSVSGIKDGPWEAHFSIWLPNGKQYREIVQNSVGQFTVQAEGFKAAEIAGRKVIDDLIAKEAAT